MARLILNLLGGLDLADTTSLILEHSGKRRDGDGHRVENETATVREERAVAVKR